MQGSGPVLMENYLRKYDAPRPSTTGSRRPASRGRPSTAAADKMRRPGTADSIRSVGSRGSYGSNFSNASTASFLDRFATADGKEKRLLMMQKKMELNEAMQKKVQIDQRRSCTPDMLRKLSSQVDRMVSAEDLAREDLEGDDSALRNSDLMNRLSGRISVSEVMDNPLLDRHMREMTSTGMLERPRTSSQGLRSSASLPNVGRRSIGPMRTLPRDRPASRTHANSRPWAQGSRQGSRGRVSGDSLVTTLKSRLDESGITRRVLEEVLVQQPSVNSADGGNCHIADLENALRCLGVTFSNMEKIYIRKKFAGGGPNVYYQGFLESFWPTGQVMARGGRGGGAPIVMLSTTEFSKFETVLRSQLAKLEDADSKTPSTMTLLATFQDADKSNKGAVRTSALHGIFRKFGFDVSTDLAQMLGTRYCQSQNPKLLDYYRLISTINPPELTMEDRNLDKNARFFGGESEKGPAVAIGGPDVTGSFFDISEKLKEEAKGNRRNLSKCFDMLDTNGNGRLSLSDFRKALTLLRVDLSERSIESQLGAFITGDGVDVHRVMEELFPVDEDFRDDISADTDVDKVEKEFRTEVQKKWGSVLQAFRAIDREHSKSIDRRQLAYCLKNDLNMIVTPRTVNALFARWDKNGGGSIDFSEFMELFGQKSTESNLVTTKNVTEVQNQIRESIEARLDGGGGGGLLKAYKFFDRDRSGELTYDEMATGIANYANMNLEGSMQAKLMEKYDPDNSGTINFSKFVNNVMCSSTKDGSSVNRQATTKAGTRASDSWTVEQLEQAIKKKMERSWTQILDACRSADLDNSNTISRDELRGLLEQFCFVLGDKQFEMLAQRLKIDKGGEIPYDDFMRYFARLGGTYYQTLPANMSIENARKAIQEKISSKLTGGPGGLLRAFKMFDRDRSGGLDYAEFAKVLREVAMIEIDPELSEKLMASYDVDGDGTLDYHEFVQQVMGSSVEDKSSFDNEEAKVEEVASSTAINRRWESAEVDECLRKKLGERPAHIKRLFNSCDNQRNGTCTVGDLRTILRKSNLDMTHPQFGEVLSHFDIIDEKYLNYEDFIEAYVDVKADTVPRDVSIINDMSTADAKLLIQDAIKSRLGTGQAELLRAFKFFDRDRSGNITLNEFQEAMKVYAMLEFSDELAAKLMKEFDEDGNGEIDYEEFTTLVMGSKKDDLTSLNTSSATEHVSTGAGNDMMMLRRKVRTQWKDLIQAFRDVDTDKSGTLDEAELRRVLHRYNIDLGESQFAELMSQIDEDRDGAVSYAEFMKFFGKGQAEDRILHTVVHNVTVKQAQTMMADKVAERYGLGPEGPAQMKKAFHFFDSGETGRITVEDFTSAMIQYTGLEFEPEIIVELLRPFNNGGQIDYQQFAKKGMGDEGSTGFDVGRRKYTRAGDKPQSPPMDAPANPGPHVDSAGANKMLKLIAEKVEAKSRNIAVTFRNFDEDKSGSVDYDEFRKGLMHLGVEMSDSDFANLLAIVDNDKSGCINYQEFVEDLKHVDEQTGGFMGDPQSQKMNAAARVSIVEPAPIVQAAPGRSSGTILHQIADKVEQKAKNIRVVFRNFDEDKSGSVDYQEFRKGLEHIGIILTDVDFQTLLDVVDNDKSGTIDYNECVARPSDTHHTHLIHAILHSRKSNGN
jgi:Ca2+-binding EF-hand superfamily protein